MMRTSLLVAIVGLSLGIAGCSQCVCHGDVCQDCYGTTSTAAPAPAVDAGDAGEGGND
jgi:hypothetical protein